MKSVCFAFSIRKHIIVYIINMNEEMKRRLIVVGQWMLDKCYKIDK